jgi:uncharacterized membrane protein (UPF0127 family)
MNGKGSKPRPLSISYDEYSDNWDNIFSQKAVVPIKIDEKTKEQYIEIPDSMIKNLNWKVGDELIFSENEDGTFSITKE